MLIHFGAKYGVGAPPEASVVLKNENARVPSPVSKVVEQILATAADKNTLVAVAEGDQFACVFTEDDAVSPSMQAFQAIIGSYRDCFRQANQLRKDLGGLNFDEKQLNRRLRLASLENGWVGFLIQPQWFEDKGLLNYLKSKARIRPRQLPPAQQERREALRVQLAEIEPMEQALHQQAQAAVQQLVQEIQTEGQWLTPDAALITAFRDGHRDVATGEYAPEHRP